MSIVILILIVILIV